MKRDDRRIAGLLRERDALVSQGKDDRVEQVDEQLELFGYTVPAKKDPPVPAPPKPGGNVPQGRSSKPSNQTTT